MRILTFGTPSILALAIFPFIILPREIPPGIDEGAVILHEKIHIRQQLELLVVPFYLWYAASYLLGRLRGKGHRDAYRDIIFEREAEARMFDAGYLARRRLYAFLKYRGKKG